MWMEILNEFYTLFLATHATTYLPTRCPAAHIHTNLTKLDTKSALSGLSGRARTTKYRKCFFCTHQVIEYYRVMGVGLHQLLFLSLSPFSLLTTLIRPGGLPGLGFIFIALCHFEEKCCEQKKYKKNYRTTSQKSTRLPVRFVCFSCRFSFCFDWPNNRIT